MVGAPRISEALNLYLREGSVKGDGLHIRYRWNSL